jgi:hypothetical protein
VRRSALRLLALVSAAACAAGCGGRPAPSPAVAFTAPPLVFKDVAASAGLRFVPDRTLKPPLDILQTAGYGGGFLDYDGDGLLDVLLLGHPRCALYRNRGAGKFEEVTGRAGLSLSGYWMGCASGDFDNDGQADLFLSGYHTAALLRNEGGRFRRLPLAFPPGGWGTSACFLDYDADGRLDLYVGCYVEYEPGAGGADSPNGTRFCPSEGVPLACSPTHYDAQTGHLYRNEGGGAFRDVTGASGLTLAHGKTLGVAPCDYDGDGRTDLYLANDGMPGDLFHNEGGRFLNVGLESGTAFNHEGKEQAGMGVDWGDCTGDGRLDLLVTTFQFEPTSLYVPTGTAFREEGFQRGLGAATINSLGFGARFCDLDNDGDLDLAIANGHVQDGISRVQPSVGFAQPAQLFTWQGEGFVEEKGSGSADLRRPVVGRAVAAGDYDNDGRTDLLITNNQGPPLLLHNETAGAGHWLSLRLSSAGGQAGGAGAVVTAKVQGRTLVRTAGASGSYLATSDPRVRLGLGGATRVESVQVRWPSGRTETWHGLDSDRETPLAEGGAGTR